MFSVKRRTTKAEGFRRAAFDEYLKQGAFPEKGTRLVCSTNKGPQLRPFIGPEGRPFPKGN